MTWTAPLDDLNSSTAGPPAWVDQVIAAQRGEAAAQAVLYRHFLPLVHGILLSRCRPARADELTQDCFVLAFARLGQLREPAAFGGWLAAIARRMRIPEDPIERSDAASDTWTDPHAGPDERVAAAEVLQAIRRLPAAYRETLMLRLVEGQSAADIAALTGLTPASVRVNLHRGMARLRQALGIQAVETSVRSTPHA